MSKELGALMEKEIREQPRVLAKNASRYYKELKEKLGGQQFDLALLAARGSSDHAALYLRYLLEIHLQIPVVLAAPSVLTRYGSQVRYPKTLAIGISQSGASPDIAGLIEYMKGAGHTTLAMTNTEGSALSEVSDHTLLLNAGTEKSVAATKTYTASLLAAYQLCRALGADLPAPDKSLPSDDWVEKCHECAEQSLGPVLRSFTLFTLARGYGFCTAHETALKMMECALVSCKSYSTADFAHGPRALATHGASAVVYGEVPDGLEQSGCMVLRAPETPLPEAMTPLAPVWSVMYGQWLALLAARARGLNPDRPTNLTKVTRTL